MTKANSLPTLCSVPAVAGHDDHSLCSKRLMRIPIDVETRDGDAEDWPCVALVSSGVSLASCFGRWQAFWLSMVNFFVCFIPRLQVFRFARFQGALNLMSQGG